MGKRTTPSGVEYEAGWPVERPRQWVDRAGTRWSIVMSFEPAAPRGLVECTSVTIRAEGDPLPVTTTVLRQLPLAGLIEAEKQHQALTARQHADLIRAAEPPEWIHDEPWMLEAFEATKDVAADLAAAYGPQRGPRRRGRGSGYEPQHFQRVAIVYLRHDTGHLSTPTKAVAKAFNVPMSTANKWVARAREMALLPEPERGRPRRRT